MHHQDQTRLRDELRNLQEKLEHGLIDRRTPMQLLLLAALAEEHALLIGPPGIAKRCAGGIAGSSVIAWMCPAIRRKTNSRRHFWRGWTPISGRSPNRPQTPLGL